MAFWAWFLIGFIVLLAFGAIVDYSNKRKRRGNPTTIQNEVDDLKTKQQKDVNHYL